ncbi:MAG TPA: hypothetical protein VL361_13710 [Candidatus Limnocylindrales bacterium]|jgi:DNA-binding response OmpR family regulator|nr:hypothetical protein [Candidatus Limnocylindrales bacterium]
MSDIPATAPADSEVPGIIDTGTSPPKRILLVEGDGFTRLVLLLRLRLAGFAVDFTSNGYLGLGKLRACRPDILLMELKLCGLSGMDLMKAARAEPTFGKRPIYVFTHAERLHRAVRKELVSLATKVFDKSVMTREELVQTFAAMFLREEATKKPSVFAQLPKASAEAVAEVVSAEEIEEIIQGVRDQCQQLTVETEKRPENGEELLSRVRSLRSCAEAASLADLARQANALENYLNQIGKAKEGYTEGALTTVRRSVGVMSRMPLDTAQNKQALSRFSVCAVDEAASSKQALTKGLTDAGLQIVSFEEASEARKHLACKSADLIIVNLVLPEAHGLALSDIRQLPLHRETPVLFGPESNGAGRFDEHLPTSARRLETDPLLLAEMVVKALNEVQNTGPTAAENVESEIPQEIPSAFDKTQPAPRAEVDSFDLFAQTPTHLSFDKSIPTEPFQRIAPGTSGPDQEAEFLIRLPETTIDGSQIDERPLEAANLVDAEAPRPETPMPDDAGAGAEAETIWRVAATNESAQIVPDTTNASATNQNEAAVVEEYAAPDSNYGDAMNHQFERSPAAYPESFPAAGQNSPREDLAARVCAAEMALYHAKAEVERKDKTIEALQNQLAEAAAEPEGAGGTPTDSEQKALARCAELEQEVASLREAFADFNGGFGQQQEAAAETDNRVKELEERLHESVAELEKRTDEYQRERDELRQQLEAASAASQPVETARQDAEARCAQLQQELQELRKSREELANQLAQKASSKPSQSSPAESETDTAESELEQQVRQGVAALARATAELARERGERQRSQQRATELNQRMQALHDDLKRTLQAQREDQDRISTLEEEQRQTNQALEKRTADLEQTQAEQRLADAQVQKMKEANAQLRKDLAFFEEASKKFGGGRQELQARLESTLNAARENEARLQQETTERQRLAEHFEEAKRELQNQTRRRESLEQELKATQEALQEREARLQKESAERQRLNEALRSAQGYSHEDSERDLELTKLQSSLEEEQVERKRQETQLARIRQKAVDAAHAARALRTNLRRQIRQPIDNLARTTHSLLELEMGEDQKRLAEAVLQDVLLVQTRLREPDFAQADQSDVSSHTAT